MNKERRKRIGEALRLISQAIDIIRDCADEENDAYENLPEGLRDSDKGMDIQMCAEDLETEADLLEAVVSDIEDIVDV